MSRKRTLDTTTRRRLRSRLTAWLQGLDMTEYDRLLFFLYDVLTALNYEEEETSDFLQEFEP